MATARREPVPGSVAIALLMGIVFAAGAGIVLPVTGSGITEPATPSGVPIVALVNHSASDDGLFLGQFCGGVVVSPRRVITASHCLAGRSPATVDVVAGVDDLCQRPAPPTLRRSAVLAIRERPHTGGTVSTLELARPVAPRHHDAAGPGMPMTGTVVPGVAVTGWGWGRDAVAGIPSCALRRVALVAVAPVKCGTIAAVTFARAGHRGGAAYLCAVPAGATNTCNGDSGGPVTALDENGSPRVIAMTLAGVGCGPASLGLSVILE